MEQTNIQHYTSALEGILAQEGERARGYSWIHNKCSEKFNRIYITLSIPSIILSTIIGATSVGSNSLFGSGSNIANVVLGGLSIVVGIVNTLNGTFAFAKRSEGHRLVSQNYAKLFTFISIELALSREERIPPSNFIKMIREEMERLNEIAPPLDASVIKQFNREFKQDYKDIAKPIETNGLAKISVFKTLPATPTLNEMSSGNQP